MNICQNISSKHLVILLTKSQFIIPGYLNQKEESLAHQRAQGGKSKTGINEWYQRGVQQVKILLGVLYKCNRQLLINIERGLVRIAVLLLIRLKVREIF